MTQIYALTDPDSGEVRYIGKANDAAKRLKSHRRESARRRTPVYAWMRKLAAAGKAPGMIVLMECSAEEWPDKEREMIAHHRQGGRLLNVADGGDQPFCPIEVRRANGKRMNSPELTHYRLAIKTMGQAARRAEHAGAHHRVAKYRAVQDLLRAMPMPKKIEFSSRWAQELQERRNG